VILLNLGVEVQEQPLPAHLYEAGVYCGQAVQVAYLDEDAGDVFQVAVYDGLGAVQVPDGQVAHGAD